MTGSDPASSPASESPSPAVEPHEPAVEPHEPELAAKAAKLRVAVIGGGVAGLVAAESIAAIGAHATVFEAQGRAGGAVQQGEADGLAFDAGAESFAVRGGHVSELLSDLGLDDRVVSPEPGGAWVAGIPGGAAPLPKGGLLGIPANPFAEDVRRVIGWNGTWRAWLDRLLPPLTIGHDHSLGRLVRKRMGARVLDRLVAPVSTGVYSAHPDDIDVDVAAPTLNAALTRAGSLSGAVAEITGAAGPTPGAAVQGLAGGMSGLVDALVARIGLLGSEVRTGAPVQALERDDDGWIVQVPVTDRLASGSLSEDAEGDRDETPQPDGDRVSSRADSVGARSTTPEEDERFDAVIVAADESTARRLLGPHVPELASVAAGASPRIEIVTLVLDAPELAVAPRGSGVLTVPGTHTAKALTHSTAKWGWLRERAGTRQIVRVSFGSAGEDPATAVLDDEAAGALALAEASALLGVELTAAQLRGSHRARFIQAQPSAVSGAAERRTTAAAAVSAVAGVGATGAWLSGTGLAQVVPHAKAEAERIRHSLLWG
ncbi:FAD-dependent oxidoreductase [Microbacterium sp. Au-Mic1]|uniref:protoporphyrinogen/coproporphyrinogen oxidase n=1 Tax=Microbacterium sp. Au-Mic1 TaxID=2906457 RepID=UPI001E5EAE97|nr:FAD-dependent oxidoreductase [Microbacterium sp. Au-Mic1]MCE4027694.1 FAD-dependent oxidoreductase [Microbacterium sp. Au-Mic1]